MNIIFDYLTTIDFERSYAKYGEIVFEIFLHTIRSDSTIIDLFKNNNATLDVEHKKKLFKALMVKSPFPGYIDIDLNDYPDEIKTIEIEYLRNYGDIAKLSKYADLTEHDIHLICSYQLWLSYALTNATDANFKKIVDYLICNFKENILDSYGIKLFANNTPERREYIANKLFDTVDIRVLSILIRANSIDDIANKYRDKYIDTFIEQMDKYDGERLYQFIRSFRKNIPLPSIVENKLLTNKLYMNIDAMKCKTICKKNNISAELKKELNHYIKSGCVLKALSI